MALIACGVDAPAELLEATTFVAPMAQVMLATTADPACATPKAALAGTNWRTCETVDEKNGPCAKYDTPASDRCAAESGRSPGVTVDYRYFGKVDCRSSTRKAAVHRIVLHNGDDAEGNTENWQCRKSAAHYTIDRDGTIYQHIGEERQAWHVVSNNADSIGIELEIRRKQGKSCNKLTAKLAATFAEQDGTAPSDVIATTCGPTDAQYRAVKRLVDDIKTRHAITEVLGHCELSTSGHHDPRAFDWRRIGQTVRPEVGDCDQYDIQAVKARVTNLVRKADGSTRVTINRGAKAGIEVGDHGWLENDAEEIAAWFTVEKVTESELVTSVALSPEVARASLAAGVVATPGQTPEPLGAAASPTVSGSKSRPALGSCESDFTYHKTGSVQSWNTAPDGSITELVLKGAGWSHRVCDDSRGMIYLGDKSDVYVTDESGNNVRFQMKAVDETISTAVITHGRLLPAMLDGNRRVVVRKRK